MERPEAEKAARIAIAKLTIAVARLQIHHYIREHDTETANLSGLKIIRAERDLNELASLIAQEGNADRLGLLAELAEKRASEYNDERTRKKVHEVAPDF